MISNLLDKRYPFATSDAQIAAVDEWRRKQPDLPSRSEAIRRLIDIGLGMKPTPRLPLRKRGSK